MSLRRSGPRFYKLSRISLFAFLDFTPSAAAVAYIGPLEWGKFLSHAIAPNFIYLAPLWHFQSLFVFCLSVEFSDCLVVARRLFTSCPPIETVQKFLFEMVRHDSPLPSSIAQSVLMSASWERSWYCITRYIPVTL